MDLLDSGTDTAAIAMNDDEDDEKGTTLELVYAQHTSDIYTEKDMHPILNEPFSVAPTQPLRSKPNHLHSSGFCDFTKPNVAKHVWTGLVVVILIFCFVLFALSHPPPVHTSETVQRLPPYPARSVVHCDCIGRSSEAVIGNTIWTDGVDHLVDLAHIQWVNEKDESKFVEPVLGVRFHVLETNVSSSTMAHIPHDNLNSSQANHTGESNNTHIKTTTTAPTTVRYVIVYSEGPVECRHGTRNSADVQSGQWNLTVQNVHQSACVLSDVKLSTSCCDWRMERFIFRRPMPHFT
jgi:hypothetical protein